MSAEVIYDVEAGGTRSVMSVHRDEHEALVISGQSVGRAPRAMFGDGDYEYWITIAATDAAAIDVAALRELANGEPGGSRAIQAWLEQSSIPFRFTSYM